MRIKFLHCINTQPSPTLLRRGRVARREERTKSRVGSGLLGSGILLAFAATSAQAQERIVVTPPSVALTSARDARQVVVTGFFGGQPRDLTEKAVFTSSNPKIAKLVGSRVAVAGDGKASVTVKVAGKVFTVPVSVSGAKKADPVRFAFETVPILTKQGCASGSCHGSPHGKGGFSLSLFGYEPKIDRIALTRDGFSRRVNTMEPAESLMLKKPTLAIPHVGGKRLRVGDTRYTTLNQWIAEGAEVGVPSASVAKIEVTPGGRRVLEAPYKNQQLSVIAELTDGTKRDVTALATYESSHPSVASVDADGKITGKSRGFAAVSVRYLDKVQALDLTVVEPRPSFVWKPQPEKNAIDGLVNSRLKQLQCLPAATCSDSEFLRRVSLDLTGMLPGAAASKAFLADKSPEKRAKLIDSLLASEEFARFWALKKADLMRVSPKHLTTDQAGRFSRWLVEATRTNLPYDKLADAIITATGSTEQSPAASYFLAIKTPEERTELTAQVFLGSRIECAKCHNHPFENWTMRDYYKIAAVFARTEAKKGQVTLATKGEVKHPTTGENMEPWSKTASSTEDRRTAFARWLTTPQNPFFARVEANRIWAELTGRGIVEPVDDFRVSNPPSNPALLDWLTQEFVKSGFDRKKLIRLICQSQTYQRVAVAPKAADEALFSHAKVRLLTAEQLQDAIGATAGMLASATTLPTQLAALDSQLTQRAATLEAEYPSWLATQTRLAKALPLWQSTWRDSEKPLTDITEGQEYRFEEGERQTRTLTRTIHSDVARTVTIALKFSDQATLKVNGAALPGNLKRTPTHMLNLQPGENTIELRMTGDNLTFTWKLADDTSGLSSPLIEALRAENTAPVHDFYLANDAKRTQLLGQRATLDDRVAYATQRPWPEQTAFTKTFGQPARETACTCERRQTPTLLQALELLNGRTSYETVAAGAARYAAFSDTLLLDELYLTALARFPTEKERTVAIAFLKNAPERTAAVTDLLWTVVNTQEFLFQK
ncbi:DUF1553 domain-containing protein [Armatimonas sp.]|uniref:DUF1553 domain-containing protein n=1 Tax=Armatimonas sp. TaxID=1872638 RepID=UPI00286D0327|nr:DUF1553 domain-containing protein [Armatimonas sp.]